MTVTFPYSRTLWRVMALLATKHVPQPSFSPLPVGGRQVCWPVFTAARGPWVGPGPAVPLLIFSGRLFIAVSQLPSQVRHIGDAS